MRIARSRDTLLFARAAAASAAPAAAALCMMTLALPTTAATARQQGHRLVGRLRAPAGSGKRPLISGFVHGPTLTRGRPLSPADASAASGAAVATRPMTMQALWEKAMALAPARATSEVSGLSKLSLLLLSFLWRYLCLAGGGRSSIEKHTHFFTCWCLLLHSTCRYL